MSVAINESPHRRWRKVRIATGLGIPLVIAGALASELVYQQFNQEKDANLAVADALRPSLTAAAQKEVCRPESFVDQSASYKIKGGLLPFLTFVSGEVTARRLAVDTSIDIAPWPQLPTQTRRLRITPIDTKRGQVFDPIYIQASDGCMNTLLKNAGLS